MPDECKPKNGRGTIAMLSCGIIIALVGTVWAQLGSRIGTLERLTNQRLASMEDGLAVDRVDNPIRHTEAISTLQLEVSRNDARSEERKQETVHSLQDHEGINGHPFVVTRVTAMEEKLIEVETQFRHLDRFIQLLWQRTYDEPLPNPPAKD